MTNNNHNHHTEQICLFKRLSVALFLSHSTIVMVNMLFNMLAAHVFKIAYSIWKPKKNRYAQLTG